MMTVTQIKQNHVLCFGWMGLKAAVHALQRGATTAKFTAVVEEANDLTSYFPEGTTMPHIIDYQAGSDSHQENWAANQKALQALSASISKESLILITDLDSQECTYALTRYIRELEPYMLKDAFLIAITPFSEDSLNWKRALPYLSAMKVIPVRKSFVHLPELIISQQLGKLTVVQCEKYFCAYINNMIEEELG